MAKTDWTMNETVLPADMNQIGKEINEKTKTVLSTTPPATVDSQTIWLEDLGEDFDLGGGGLLIGNASLDGDETVWFDQNI